jgi:hypothetical protein
VTTVNSGPARKAFYQISPLSDTNFMRLLGWDYGENLELFRFAVEFNGSQEQSPFGSPRNGGPKSQGSSGKDHRGPKRFVGGCRCTDAVGAEGRQPKLRPISMLLCRSSSVVNDYCLLHSARSRLSDTV